MKVPQRSIGPWARELIDECYVSRDTRLQNVKTYKSYYISGTETGDQARYNRCFGHVDRLSSMLFSPIDVRFDIEPDQDEDETIIDITEGSTRFLNREYARTGCDIEFGEGVNLALVSGCVLLKTVWGHNGLEPWIVQPEHFGVLREDIEDLDRQEAFVQSSYYTKSAFQRYIEDNPDKAEINREVEASFKPRDMADYQDSFFHQVLIGGNYPVGATPTNAQGSVGIEALTPMLSTDVARDLVRVDELWVMDDKRQDYTTIRLAGDTCVIEGRNKHRNILADGDMPDHPFLKGEQPFRKICPNKAVGYFWGMSEIAQVAPLQDLLNGTIRDITRLTKLKADPPRAGIGFTGMTQEKYRAARRPGGFLSEDSPGAKLEDLSPNIPPELFAWLERIDRMFDDVAGFAPILTGQGDPSVRSAAQGQTMTRNATPRLRDRAVLVERQAVEHGDLCLKILQSKNAEIFNTRTQKKYRLANIPDDYRISIDSHTSSPAFAEDNERKAFALHRSGAIDAQDLIMLTHPPHEDSLILRARKRADAEAKMIAQHPELAFKGKGKKK